VTVPFCKSGLLPGPRSSLIAAAGIWVFAFIFDVLAPPWFVPSVLYVLVLLAVGDTEDEVLVSRAFWLCMASMAVGMPVDFFRPLEPGMPSSFIQAVILTSIINKLMLAVIMYFLAFAVASHINQERRIEQRDQQIADLMKLTAPPALANEIQAH